MKSHSIVITIILATGLLACHSAQTPSVQAQLEHKDPQQLIKSKTITAGEFAGIPVGASKRDVLARLKQLKVDAISPELINPIQVTQPAELARLRHAPGVILFPGDVKIIFAGDNIEQVKVLPFFRPAWKARLEAARTRSEAFTVLAEILEADKSGIVGDFVPGGHWVRLTSVNEQDLKLLEHTDAWETNYRDHEGYWHLRLEFSGDRLKRIVTQYSASELP